MKRTSCATQDAMNSLKSRFSSISPPVVLAAQLLEVRQAFRWRAGAPVRPVGIGLVKFPAPYHLGDRRHATSLRLGGRVPESPGRPGETTFHFVNDGIDSALDQAREAVGDRDVRIAGGARRYVNAGLIDEFSIALSPVLFGSGIRLFEGVEPVRAETSPRVTHLTYAVRER
jgi:hypothetical protein